MKVLLLFLTLLSWPISWTSWQLITACIHSSCTIPGRALSYSASNILDTWEGMSDLWNPTEVNIGTQAGWELIRPCWNNTSTLHCKWKIISLKVEEEICLSLLTFLVRWSPHSEGREDTGIQKDLQHNPPHLHTASLYLVGECCFHSNESKKQG